MAKLKFQIIFLIINKQTDSYFLRKKKIGFVQEQQRTTILDMKFKGKPHKSLEKQRKGNGLGRSCCKQRVHLRKLNVLSIVTFHWLYYGSPHWLRCYWAEGIVSSSCWGTNVASLPVRDTRYSSSCWG